MSDLIGKTLLSGLGLASLTKDAIHKTVEGSGKKVQSLGGRGQKIGQGVAPAVHEGAKGPGEDGPDGSQQAAQESEPGDREQRVEGCQGGWKGRQETWATWRCE